VKAILVVSLECEPEDVPDAITHIDPPNIPHFAGDVRVAVEDVAQHVLDWLDG